MFWSKTLIPTLRQIPQEAESVSHQLLLRAGLVRMLAAGIYSYLPLGLRVLNNLCTIIREEMNRVSANELLLPALQPIELWQKSQRDSLLGEVMIRFTDRKGRKLCLGPTHEEVITDLVKNHVFSYKQLPLILYQIQTKFRDEIRPRFGLIRACEFIMKDAYSFDKDEEGLDKNYQLIHGAYLKIFRRCGLDVLAVEADSGVMGGNLSHEFMVLAEDAEDKILFCGSCRKAYPFKENLLECSQCGKKLEERQVLELGHIFKLGVKYSLSLGANFSDKDGKIKPLIMGCYGIGVSRVIAAVIEQNHDKDGIIWPEEVAPFKTMIIPLDTTDSKIMQLSLKVYQKLKEDGFETLLDDRDERAGVKFKDADLLGVPYQIIIGQKAIKEGSLELKKRLNKEKIFLKPEEIIAKLKE